MGKLLQMKCGACREGAPKVTDVEIKDLLLQVPDWKIVEQNKIKRLVRTFKFDNFSQGLLFTNQVGEIAEAEDHHPSLLTEWGQVTVSWWTHKIKGLHQNDFIMAANTDLCYFEFYLNPSA